MAKIQIELKEATGRKKMAVTLDRNTLCRDLLHSALQKLNFPEAAQKVLSDAVSDEGPYLYDPRRSIFDLHKSLKDSGVEQGDHLRYYLSAIELDAEEIMAKIDLVDDIVILDDDAVKVSIESNVDDQITIAADENQLVKLQIKDSSINLYHGDITCQVTDAIVNAAKSSLEGGGGVDYGIHDAAGPELVKASRDLAPCKPGEAVITPGFRLPARWVIHAVGPVYGGGKKGEAEILAQVYRNCLKMAINSRFRSISFPSISTGNYGYPIKDASDLVLKTIYTELKNCKKTIIVNFILFNYADFHTYQEALERLSNTR